MMREAQGLEDDLADCTAACVLLSLYTYIYMYMTYA